jgi:hypothetical protein
MASPNAPSLPQKAPAKAATKDFTLSAYQQLLQALKASGYAFFAFEDFIAYPPVGKAVVMRHDVDRIPLNALKMARIEQRAGIRATYYFRIVPQVWDEGIIQAVVDLGHEAAYHYEDLTIAKGDYQKAIAHFATQLQRLRRFYPSKTICMHGSPLSPWDNRKLWERYDYRDFGIIAEPYFDLDYARVFYITDASRAWNNRSLSVRDKVQSGFDIPIRNVFHLMRLLEADRLPQKLIINTHPHLWFEGGSGWYLSLIKQQMKNIFKYLLIKAKGDEKVRIMDQ